MGNFGVSSMVLCMLMLHAPDGSSFVLDENSIKVVKPANSKFHHANTKSVVYLSSRLWFSVTETPKEIHRLIQDDCRGAAK